MNIMQVDLMNTSNPNNPKLESAINQLQHLIVALNGFNLSDSLIAKINDEISLVNSTSLIPEAMIKFIKAKQRDILKTVEKEAKIVPKFYYRNLWLGLGMTAFGLPLGVAFGFSIGNTGLIGIGLPIGLAIGSFVGTSMDKKAFKEGRQIDIDFTKSQRC